MIKFYIPENLDIDQLTYDHPPKFKKYKYKRDKLLYIIHLINYRSQFSKDLMYEDYVSLNAKKLQEKIPDYKEYLNYLLNELKIVETDNSYIPNYKSKGFRLIEKYRTVVKPCDILDFSLRRKLKTEKNFKKTSVVGLKYLTKWFDNKLKIDTNYVKEFLQKEYKLKIENTSLLDFDRIKGKHKDPLSQLNHAMISLDKIENRDYYLFRDHNVNRFHSNLSNMRSVIRNALTYDSKNLISIDVKNSQPYLSTILFNKAFWKKENNPISRHLSYYNIKQHTLDSYIMLGDILKTLENREFNDYISLVIKGELYEFLEKNFKESIGLTYLNRRDIKSTVFQVMFTDNRFLGQVEAQPKKAFKNLFPNVYEVFRIIKQKDKTLLPRMLQSIESYLIIDVIAKKISEEHPEAPLFTIHDSIATTEEFVEGVAGIMKEKLSEAIGYPPRLSYDVWSKDNMSNELSKLTQLLKSVA